MIYASQKESSMFEGNIGFLTTFGLILSTGIMVSLYSKRKKRIRKYHQEKGLLWLSSFKDILYNTQRHRGLTTGYINGGSSLKIDIENVQNLIEKSILTTKNIEQSINENDRWQSFLDHWSRISKNYSNYEAENNLKQHNQIIKNLLYLIDDIAQDCELMHLSDHKNKPMHVYWRELLTATEHIGQARAIGTGVSAASQCNSVSRIQLNYACQKIEEQAALIEKEIGCESSTSSSIATLLRCINTEVIMDKPSIKPLAYFEIATDAIDNLMKQFDEMLSKQKDIKSNHLS
jgi:hypothetical protein